MKRAHRRDRGVRRDFAENKLTKVLAFIFACLPSSAVRIWTENPPDYLRNAIRQRNPLNK